MSSQPASRVLLFDEAESGLLGLSWQIGASLFANGFDRVEGVTTADQVLGILEESAGAELHLWGHGAPASPRVGGTRLSGHDERWGNLHTVWFRSCSVFRGQRGAIFAKWLARHHHVNAVAHTNDIGYWGMHSGLVGLRASPTATPFWTPGDGGSSAPWLPRTVPAFEMRIPEWAFGPIEKK